MYKKCMINTLNFSKYNIHIGDDIDSDALINKLMTITKNTICASHIETLGKCNIRYLLDTDNSVINKYDIVENFINKIFLFHLKRLNLDIDNSNNYYVSFSFENDELFHVNHFKCEDSKTIIYPLCTTLTYFENSLRPVVITNIDFSDYKYKNINNSEILLFSFPNKFEHICFDGKYYYGMPVIFNDKKNTHFTLKINIWDKKPTNIGVYDSKTFDVDNNNINKEIKIEFNESLCHRQIYLDKKIINRSFFDDFLYAKKNDVFVELENIFNNIEEHYSIEEYVKPNPRLEHKMPVEINLHDNNHLIIIQTENVPIIQNHTFKLLKNKYGNIMYDLYEIYYKKKLLNTNRFYVNKLSNNFFESHTCKWMVSIIDKYIRLESILNTSIFMINGHNNLNNIFDYCLSSIESIYNNLSETYGINDISINIKNMFILYSNGNIQSDETIKNHQKMIKDIKNNNSFMLAVVKLNNRMNNIEDNIKLKMGDLLFVNILRLDEINFFHMNTTEYYLFYEIDFNYEL